MMIAVLLANAELKYPNTCFSVLVSTALRQSSRITISGFLISARAIETRCFCPPERVTPRSPTMVSKPCGNSIMSL